MKNINSFFTGSVGARLITSILLFIALLNLPIGYYAFLRWLVCITAIYSLYISYNLDKKINFGVWLFSVIAILFNPMIPFYLGKSIWKIADTFVGIILFISIFILNEKRDIK